MNQRYYRNTNLSDIIINIFIDVRSVSIVKRKKKETKLALNILQNTGRPKVHEKMEPKRLKEGRKQQEIEKKITAKKTQQIKDQLNKHTQMKAEDDIKINLSSNNATLLT